MTEQERLAIRQMLTRVTVPILFKDNGLFAVGGTGTLFTIDERPFLITAGHITDSIPLDKWAFTTAPSRGRIFTFGMLDHHRPVDGTRDVAVIELKDENTIKVLRNNWDFLTLDQISLPHDDADFFIAGFPSALAAPEADAIQTALLILETRKLTVAPPNAEQPVQPSIDHFFDAGPDVFRRAGFEGLDVSGMSGSSVIEFRNSVTASLWTPKDAIRVVAIQTSVRKEQYLRAKSWPTIATVFEAITPGLMDQLMARLQEESSRAKT